MTSWLWFSKLNPIFYFEVCYNNFSFPWMEHNIIFDPMCSLLGGWTQTDSLTAGGCRWRSSSWKQSGFHFRPIIELDMVEWYHVSWVLPRLLAIKHFVWFSAGQQCRKVTLTLRNQNQKGKIPRWSKDSTWFLKSFFTLQWKLTRI